MAAAHLDGAERAIIRSRAKLAYATVTDAELPDGFVELAERVHAAETRRGASRVEPPEQGVEPLDGGYALTFRDRLESEERNAALSLATNLAVADALLAAHTGLFRTMPDPDERAVRRLRLTATAFGVAWPDAESLADLGRRLDGHDPKQAALMLAIRRASGGASYVPYEPGVVPRHSAMAATYVHATAPLRRLADRYVVRAALAVANGQPVPDVVEQAFAALPKVMDRADDTAGGIERAVVDLAEAVVLHGREGETFDAVVTDVDDRGARVQLVAAGRRRPGVGPRGAARRCRARPPGVRRPRPPGDRAPPGRLSDTNLSWGEGRQRTKATSAAGASSVRVAPGPGLIRSARDTNGRSGGRGPASTALTAGDLRGQRIQRLGERGEGIEQPVEPRPGDRDTALVERVEAPRAVTADGHQTCRAQHLQVLGHRRLGDRRRCLQRGDDRAGGLFAVGQQDQDLPAVRVAERFEDTGHPGSASGSTV